MPEFYRFLDLPSTKLARADVEELGCLVCKDLQTEPGLFEFSFSAGEKTYRAHSLDELLRQNLSASIDTLDFRVHGWSDDDKKIVRSIAVRLSRSSSNCSVRSSDETWFKGMMQQLIDFFNARKTWYKNRRVLITLLGGIQGLSFFAVFYALFKYQFLLAVLFVIIVVILNKFIDAIIFGKLFPHTDIRFSEVPRLLSNEAWAILIAAIAAIGTVAGVIVSLFK